MVGWPKPDRIDIMTPRHCRTSFLDLAQVLGQVLHNIPYKLLPPLSLVEPAMPDDGWKKWSEEENRLAMEWLETLLLSGWLAGWLTDSPHRT